jgi:hypothetical protein
MTKEDKDLILKELCYRLPYGVKMNHIIWSIDLIKTTSIIEDLLKKD